MVFKCSYFFLFLYQFFCFCAKLAWWCFPSCDKGWANIHPGHVRKKKNQQIDTSLFLCAPEPSPHLYPLYIILFISSRFSPSLFCILACYSYNLSILRHTPCQFCGSDLVHVCGPVLKKQRLPYFLLKTIEAGHGGSRL